MKNQTITSKSFKTTWLKQLKKPLTFESIKGISFIKNKLLPVYENLGGKLPPGIFYEDYNLNPENHSQNFEDLKKKVFIIYSIPKYCNAKPINLNTTKWLKHLSIKEYKGYLADLGKYDNCDQYLKDVLGKNLKDIKRRKRRLEKCFDVKYLNYERNISPETYDFIFKHFKILLKKKFDKRKEYCHILSNSHWNFYYESTYNMMLEGTASFDVILNKDIPICIDLNYHLDNICLGIIPASNPDYAKFGIGSINTVKSLEYCFLRGDIKYDFLKGGYGYKEKWVNNIYQSEHHIYYDNESLICSSLAHIFSLRFKLVQYLRNKGVNDVYHKVLFYLRVRSLDSFSFKLSKLSGDRVDLKSYTKINFIEKKYSNLHKVIFEFLYSTQNHLSDVTVYKFNNHSNKYLIFGKEEKLKLELNQ